MDHGQTLFGATMIRVPGTTQRDVFRHSFAEARPCEGDTPGEDGFADGAPCAQARVLRNAATHCARATARVFPTGR